MEVLHLIERETIKNGGCTYSLPHASLISPGEPLYSLSLHKELEEIVSMEEFDMNRIKMYIIKNSEILWSPNVALGTWVDEDRVYLDVATLFDKSQVSLDELRGMSTNQLAAWDIENNQVINLLNS